MKRTLIQVFSLTVLLGMAHRLPAPIQEIQESPTPSPTAAPTLIPTGGPSSAIEDFVKSLSINNVNGQLQLYASEVTYYDWGTVTRDAVRRDLEHDIRTWPERVYSIHEAPKVTQLSADTFEAEFPMSYTLRNSKGSSSGILEITIRFRLEGQAWRVFEIRKKPILARKSKQAG